MFPCGSAALREDPSHAVSVRRAGLAAGLSQDGTPGSREFLSPNLLYVSQRQPSCEIWESCGPGQLGDGRLGKGSREGVKGWKPGGPWPAGTRGTSSPGWPPPVAGSDVTAASAAGPAPTSSSVGRSPALSSLGKCGESLLGWREERKEEGRRR